jgi:hypothetical protein
MLPMQASTTVTRDPRIEPSVRPAGGRPRTGLDPLAREIAIVLAVKLAAIVLLWLAFFRPGDAPRSPPAAQTIARHIAAPAPSPEVSVAVH